MIETGKLKFYGIRNIESIPQFRKLSADDQFASKVVAHVLPFRTNNYVVDELINWDNIPDDPMYQLTFMQRDMLHPNHFEKIACLLKRNASPAEIKTAANEIRYEMNPHPGDQMTANVPLMDNEPVRGIQHKYRETCLVFPSSGQTCHAYCTFCFRWAQFVGSNDLKFATDESNRFQEYLKSHHEISDVLFTGGDPMIMSLKKLEAYILPLLKPEFEHIRTIRIGTKSISYWPYRFVTDKDSEGILNLFEKVMSSGKHLALMGHFNHWVELSTPIVHKAIRKLRNVGVKIRSQSPLIKHINDDSAVWARMWKDQVNLGIIPYYMFVERETGAFDYFSVPLSRSFEIYRDAFKQVSGLSRGARGPSMSASPGKVVIDGISKINGESVFVLNFLQARNAEWVKKPFFAKYDETSTWVDQLKPAFGQEKFFFEDELEEILSKKRK
ncbi:MAG: lysine 2,3-aminomutase [Calditrichaeota bacterium]|nr:MAG: lysine 2,3-aminomutase [Calditrichota bacterium]MBL1206809.1 lysine 2,3-aminomutase [Calditrichota bacterium]NOG46637.1 lysine 2,3-aminomutase [Calditrichota bacterium]